MTGGRYIRAGILFFDVKGYSMLGDIERKYFHNIIMDELYKIIKNTTRRRLLYMNTWGDGVVLLDYDIETLSYIALKWNEYFINKEYTKIDIFKSCVLNSRISIHEGEFIDARDPFQNRKGFFGNEIVRAARLEPITPPGKVWVTEEIKSRLISRWNNDGRDKVFKFLNRGIVKLAKAFGTARIYELTRP
ncbi:MAG: hypothetical protein AB1746_02180 [Candidatus Zixiibacteriota bacterium]